MLAIGLLAAIVFAQQTATAQTTPPPEGTVNSPGSVLHGRTIQVANAIVNQLAGITGYNQVTNTAQLSGVTDMNLRSSLLPLLQAGEFRGLVNLQTLDITYNHLPSLPAGLFDELVNLRTLKLAPIALSSLPAGLFDKLVNLRRLDISQNQLTNLPAGIFDGLANLQTLDLRNNPLSSLPSGIFDRLTNLQRIYFDDASRTSPSLFTSLTSVSFVGGEVSVNEDGYRNVRTSYSGSFTEEEVTEEYLNPQHRQSITNRMHSYSITVDHPGELSISGTR